MKTIIIFACMFFISISISAQSFAIGGQVGFAKAPDADKAVIFPALAARLNILNITIEGAVGYKQDEYFDGNIKVKTYPVLLTGMIKLIPFINAEAGIGWYNVKTEFSGIFANSSSQTESPIGYHFGAGAEIPFGNLILTGDLRYVFMDLKITGLSAATKLKADYYIMSVGLFLKL